MFLPGNEERNIIVPERIQFRPCCSRGKGSGWRCLQWNCRIWFGHCRCCIRLAFGRVPLWERRAYLSVLIRMPHPWLVQGNRPGTSGCGMSCFDCCCWLVPDLGAVSLEVPSRFWLSGERSCRLRKWAGLGCVVCWMVSLCILPMHMLEGAYPRTPSSCHHCIVTFAVGRRWWGRGVWLSIALSGFLP